MEDLHRRHAAAAAAVAAAEPAEAAAAATVAIAAAAVAIAAAAAAIAAADVLRVWVVHGRRQSLEGAAALAARPDVSAPPPIVAGLPTAQLLSAHPDDRPSSQGDYLCRRTQPEFRGGVEVYRCRAPTEHPWPWCDSGYTLCQTARAPTTGTAPWCKEKSVCGRKIKKCAKKERKKPWKRLKCSKKWGKDADGACTNPKTQRKCPKSCGLCG